MATNMVTRSCYVWQLTCVPEVAMYGNIMLMAIYMVTRSCYVWQLTWLLEDAVYGN